MTPFRAAIPFLVIGLSLGVVLIEFMKTESQDWTEALIRLGCIWAGASTFGVPLLLERWEEERLSRQHQQRRKRRRTSSKAEGTSK